MPRGFWALEDAVFVVFTALERPPRHLSFDGFLYRKGDLNPYGLLLKAPNGQRFAVSVRALPVPTPAQNDSAAALSVELPFGD
jgi:hypothetical protein